MTSEQWKSIITTLVTVLGGLLVAFGFIPKDTIDYLISNVSNIADAVIKIAGAVTLIGGLVYKWHSNSTASVITAAANLPEVSSIKVTTPELAGPATPANVTKEGEATVSKPAAKAPLKK